MSLVVHFLYRLLLVLVIKFFIFILMVESLLSGILLGLIPVTIMGLFFTAYLQYVRGDNSINI